MEIWKTIEDYPNYMVSSMGRVKSLKFGKEKILKSTKNKNGYVMVNLCKEGKRKYLTIHRLVAQAFLDNPNNLLQVNHIDENRQNNCVENLEWCDAKYNNTYGTRMERFIKSKSIPIFQLTPYGEFIKKWESGAQVERELGFHRSSITMCCKGKRYKSVGGYKWGYIEDYERIPFKVFDLEIYRKVS